MIWFGVATSPKQREAGGMPVITRSTSRGRTLITMIPRKEKRKSLRIGCTMFRMRPRLPHRWSSSGYGRMVLLLRRSLRSHYISGTHRSLVRFHCTLRTVVFTSRCSSDGSGRCSEENEPQKLQRILPSFRPTH